MHLDLLKVPPLRSGLIGLFTQNLILMGVFFTIPLYLQLVLGLDALDTGIKMLPVSITMFVASAMGSRLSSRFPVRTIVRAGLWHHRGRHPRACSPPSSPTWPAAGSPSSMALLGVGMGLMVSQLGNVVQSSVDASGRGEAGGLQYTGQQLGSSLGVALIGAIVLAGLTGAFVSNIEADERIADEVAAQVSVAVEPGHRLRRRRPGRGGRPGGRARRRHHRGDRRRLPAGAAEGAQGRPARRPASWPSSRWRSPATCRTTRCLGTRTHPTTNTSPSRHERGPARARPAGAVRPRCRPRTPSSSSARAGTPRPAPVRCDDRTCRSTAVFAFPYFLKLVDVVQEWLYPIPARRSRLLRPRRCGGRSQYSHLAGLVVGHHVECLPGRGATTFRRLVATGSPPPDRAAGHRARGVRDPAFGGVLGPRPHYRHRRRAGRARGAPGQKDAPAQATLVIGAAGSFAAISTLLGSPIVGAFLLMEVAGMAGPIVGVVFLPGLLAAGVGSLVFLGLNNLTGWGTFSLAVPDMPPFRPSTGTSSLGHRHRRDRCIVGTAIHSGPAPPAHRRRATAPADAGLRGRRRAGGDRVRQLTDHGTDQVLFSGENALAPLIQDASTWTVGALLLLVLCKGSRTAVAGQPPRRPDVPGHVHRRRRGLALSHLPGLPPIAGVAMGSARWP